MSLEEPDSPNYNLITSYRSSKLKIVLLFMLQLTVVFSSYILTIVADEYKNLSKSFVKDMDFKVTFTDDSNIEIEGYLEISSALSTTLYISELHGNVYIDTDDDMKYIDDPKKVYKDKHAPPVLINIQFPNPQLIKPAKMDATQTTTLKIKGKMSIPVIPNIMQKIEENLHNKLKQFRFNIYPTLTIEFAFLKLTMSRGFTIPYTISKGVFLKIVEPQDYSEYGIFGSKYQPIAKGVKISAWMNVETLPITMNGFKFESYYIKFKNSVEFDFSGDVIDFKMISNSKYAEEELKENSDFPFQRNEKPTMYNFYAAIAFKRLQNNQVWTNVYNLWSLDHYNKTCKRTHVTVLGRRSSDEWINVHDRLTLIAYRDLNLNFDVGIE